MNMQIGYAACMPRINLRSRATFPRVAGKPRPCRYAGVGAIAPGFAMLARANRASHIDPPASSYAIMRRACPYRGENPGPGKDVMESLTTGPELENSQGQSRRLSDVGMSASPPTPDVWLRCSEPTFRANSRLMRCSKVEGLCGRSTRASISPRSAGSEGASTVGGGLGKFHREAIRDAPVRGRTIRNSVNAPGWVSTSIDPPCCLTMMS